MLTEVKSLQNPINSDAIDHQTFTEHHAGGYKAHKLGSLPSWNLKAPYRDEMKTHGQIKDGDYKPAKSMTITLVVHRTW